MKQMAKAFFGSKIDPACAYCEYGKLTKDGQTVLCNRHGVVAPFYCCKKFVYAPLKRVPGKVHTLQKFEKSDFAL